MATVTVTKDYDNGTVEVSVDGVKGKKCVELTAAFESAMGKKQKFTPTRDMNLRDDVAVNVR